MFDVLDVEEVIGGDSPPGVRVVLVGQPVLKLRVLSPDLLTSRGALALAKQSSHDSAGLSELPSW